jgi:alkylated DNA repair dioxygenase AlkB
VNQVETVVKSCPILPQTEPAQLLLVPLKRVDTGSIRTPDTWNLDMPNQQSIPFGGELLPTDGSAVLIPGFLTPEASDAILQELLTTEPWESQSLHMYGKMVSEPRLSTWHAEPHVTYTYSGALRTPIPWTPTLLALREACEQQTAHTFNGLLVNQYRNGNDHLGWHADNELSNGPEPLIASLSFGAERRFDLRHRETNQIVSTQLPHGSLLVMSGLSQKCWLHRVAKEPHVRQPRVNLTFRHLVDVG